MSGHSHFKTVKATKEANAAKRGKIFAKLSRVITIAVKEKGPDASTNSQLKSAIERAKEFNMPKENIERAIKKGTGELAGENLEGVSFEAFGPSGTALIIEGITDNKNRTISEVKTVLLQFNGKMAGEGAIKWMFERKGYIEVNCKEGDNNDLDLLAIEAGAEDIKRKDDILEIHTKPEELEKVKKSLQEKGLQIGTASLWWIPKEEIAIANEEKETINRLFEALNENEAIQDIYSNLDSSE